MDNVCHNQQQPITVAPFLLDVCQKYLNIQFHFFKMRD